MTSLQSLVLSNPLLPWRLRHAFEVWTETKVRGGLPALYRFLHHGRLREIVRPVTFGPRHHFFGYYEKTPWSRSGDMLLAHQAPFNDRAPQADDAVTIGVIRRTAGDRFEPLATTRAWNWQQGAMLQWHPADPERLLLHNDHRDGQFVGVVRDTQGQEINLYDRPMYAIAPDGRQALSLNFARLATHRPGYGYDGVPDPFAADPQPAQDGIFRIDLGSGQAEQIISLAQLASLSPKPSMSGAWHYVNHIQISPSGRRFAFFHIWYSGQKSWEVRLYVCNMDGGALHCLLDSGTVSHYDWMDDGRILIWANKPGSGGRFLLVDAEDASNTVFGEGILTEDGHCSYSPDRRWILNDTYPDRYDMRTLMLVRAADAKRVDLARLYSPKSRWWGEIRCDLHPRWSRDGTQVCIDSVHTGERQMYVVDVTEWVK